MTTAIEILVAARELLSDPSHWTRGDLARNAAGDDVNPRSKKAVCWCLLGAVRKSPFGAMNGEIALDLIYGVVGGSIGGFNDSPYTTHADVLRVLDAAIEKATKP